MKDRAGLLLCRAPGLLLLARGCHGVGLLHPCEDKGALISGLKAWSCVLRTLRGVLMMKDVARLDKTQAF